MSDWDFSGLKATFVNCTLKKSPELSHTQGLVDASASIMREHGVQVDEIRFVDHDVATGVYPDMREHGWEADAWPDLGGCSSSRVACRPRATSARSGTRASTSAGTTRSNADTSFEGR